MKFPSTLAKLRSTIIEIMADEDLLTLKEVRDKLRISRMTLHRYIAGGKLSVVRLSQRKVYVRKKELERFIRESER